MLIAVGIGIALLIGVSYLRGSGDEPVAVESLIAGVDTSLGKERYVEAIQDLDSLIDAATSVLLAGKTEDALKLFREIGRLSKKGREKTATKELQDRFHFNTREATARYMIAVCLYKKLAAEHGMDPRSGEPALKDPHRQLAPLGEELNLSVKLDPTQKRPWRLLGIVELMRGRFVAAEQALKKAIDLDPEFAEAYGPLGRVYVRMRNFKEAEDQFEKALLLGHSNKEIRQDALFNLGMFYGGRTEAAMAKQKHSPTTENYRQLEVYKAKAAKNLNAFLETGPRSKEVVSLAREQLKRLTD